MEPSTIYIAGHVDAGKSTLMGHLLYQLGNVNKRLMHKYEQESKKVGKSSFAYAWVLDETEEERFVDINRLFAYCKGGNFIIHIRAWFSVFIC